MTRRLTKREWESVCESAAERRAAGATWHAIEQELEAAGIVEEDLQEIEARCGRWLKRER